MQADIVGLSYSKNKFRLEKLDETAVDEIGVDDTAVDEIGVDEPGRYLTCILLVSSLWE